MKNEPYYTISTKNCVECKKELKDYWLRTGHVILNSTRILARHCSQDCIDSMEPVTGYRGSWTPDMGLIVTDDYPQGKVILEL